MQGNSVVSQLESHVAHDATFHGIHQWFKHVVEHLGWMVICKNEIKINAYKNSVNELRAAVENRLRDTEDKDRKKDLEIIMKKLKIFIEHVEKDFDRLESVDQKGGAKKRGKTKSKSKSKGKKQMWLTKRPKQNQSLNPRAR